jgi:uncharacterized protein
MSDSSARSSFGSSKIEFLILDKYKGKLSGCTLVTGFYGIGKVGFISVNHMVEKLGAERIGAILSDFLPPFLSVKNDNLVLPFEIYKYQDIIFLSAFFEPYKYEHRSFARALVKWAKKNELSHSILIGGLDSRLKTEDELLAKGVYSSKFKEKFKSLPVPIMDEGLFITGPLALVLMYAELENFPAMGVMPYAERSRPDPIAASYAVEIMNDLLQTDCGVDELVQEAESIETELQTMEGLLEDEEELNKDKNRDGGLFL